VLREARQCPLNPAPHGHARLDLAGLPPRPRLPADVGAFTETVYGNARLLQALLNGNNLVRYKHRLRIMRNKAQEASAFLRVALATESRDNRQMADVNKSNEIREYLKLVLATTGWSGARLAREIGVSASTINKRLKPEWTKGAHMTTLRKIADASQIPIPNSITGGIGTPISVAGEPFAPQHIGVGVSQARHAFGTETMPVLATAKGPKYMKMRPIVAERVPRPSILASVANAYAIRVHDEQASPRYDVGSLLFVNPILPLLAGSAVLLASAPGNQECDMMLRRLVEETTETWVVETFNGAETVTLSRSEWPVAHRIVGSLEL
jgi:lambda repressor-like predicted transcriptional regulator